MQQEMPARAVERREQNTISAISLDEVEEILREVTRKKGSGKWMMAHLKDDPACNARLKQFKATVRRIPAEDECDGAGKCIETGDQWTGVW
jgi:prolyl-tRNA synthetase